MKTFRLIESRVEYWAALIEAENREQALEIWEKDQDLTGQTLDWDEFGCCDPDVNLETVEELDISNPTEERVIWSHEVEPDRLRFVDEPDPSEEPDACPDCECLKELCRCNDEKRLGRIP